MAQVSIDINQDGPENLLQCMEAYFDGSYWYVLVIKH